MSQDRPLPRMVANIMSVVIMLDTDGRDRGFKDNRSKIKIVKVSCRAWDRVSIHEH